LKSYKSESDDYAFSCRTSRQFGASHQFCDRIRTSSAICLHDSFLKYRESII